MSLIYLVIEKIDSIPILTASTREKAKELLDEYMGLPPYFDDKNVEYLGYFPYDSKWPDIYEGDYKYRDGEDIQVFSLFCISLDKLN